MGALCAVLLLPAASDAQQTTSNTPTVFPVGITVVASGTFTATDVLNVYTVMPKKGANAAALMRDLKAAGLGPSSLQRIFLTVVVRAAPARDAAVRSAIARAGWKVQGEPTSEPADAEAASRAALAVAVHNARLNAEAIARADHRHVGKLLNVEPSPGDYLKSLAGFNPMAAIESPQGPQVTATEIFTFALLP
ncbi:MAG: hypothetical protein ACYCPH_03115 [Minisyncoccota bacterium]